jgi:hypothetical protein
MTMYMVREPSNIASAGSALMNFEKLVADIPCLANSAVSCIPSTTTMLARIDSIMDSRVLLPCSDPFPAKDSI